MNQAQFQDIVAASDQRDPQGRVVLRDVDFRDATFTEPASFVHLAFTGTTRFTRTTFEREVSFENVTFEGAVDFDQASFVNPARFSHAAFPTSESFEALRPPRASHSWTRCSARRPRLTSAAPVFPVTASLFERGAYFNGASFSGEYPFLAAVFGEGKTLPTGREPSAVQPCAIRAHAELRPDARVRSPRPIPSNIPFPDLDRVQRHRARSCADAVPCFDRASRSPRRGEP
jgi:hypothetical protein